MNLKIIEVWNGSNYQAIIRALINEDTEIRIRVSGKRLIIKDPESGFYKCIPKGDPVEIPVHEHPRIIDDPVIEIEEPKHPCMTISEMTEEQKQMYREWGLL